MRWSEPHAHNPPQESSLDEHVVLGAADAGFWFHAPDSIVAEFPQFPANHTYDELFASITAAL